MKTRGGLECGNPLSLWHRPVWRNGGCARPEKRQKIVAVQNLAVLASAFLLSAFRFLLSGVGAILHRLVHHRRRWRHQHRRRVFIEWYHRPAGCQCAADDRRQLFARGRTLVALRGANAGRAIVDDSSHNDQHSDRLVAVTIDRLHSPTKRGPSHDQLGRRAANCERQRHGQVHHREPANGQPLLSPVQAVRLSLGSPS